ncbi:MAG TPA: ATP-binding cassette domain-containing protein [Steroidobacteraceae bacterium]|jgi:ATP-binding cassette subfamily F protein 3|nr:ATP-binding cassette domain-containing protein [Steroidobacteraceae bacterium]
MLTLAEVRLRRGPQVLIDGATCGIFRGEKTGIVGRNGCGKSTLLALIRGDLAPDAGEYRAPPGLAIAAVAQELPATDATLVEYVRGGDLELAALEAQIPAAEGTRLAMLHAEYDRLGGYAARSRAGQLAAGLGFASDDLERPVRNFSGGLQMRANLARTLMRRSDVLLLDEPTNHLDLDAVLWLEGWLHGYAGTLLLVSHDREFLDGVVGRILHIEAGRLRSYTGNYSAFETQRAAEAERTQAMLAGQARERARVESFVTRFRAQASKARQVQSRLKWLARLPDIASLHLEQGFEWEFATPAKLPRPLLTLEHAVAGYGDRRVLSDVALSVSPGDRIGILGRNGAGKSTLMRLLAAQLQPLAGAIETAPDVATGFFAQLELEHLDADGTALAELERRGGPEQARWSELDRRNHLGRFGFHGDRVFEPTRQFSGGERARLALAILVARKPNLLLLDEPTNHLDLDMRHALLVALQDFAGAVVIVSHDRALLRGACDRFLLVANGVVAPFEGDLEDYAAWLARGSETPQAEGAEPAAAPSRREQRRLEAEARNRLTPLRAEQRRLEHLLERLTAERTAIESRLADPATYAAAGADEQRRLSSRHGELGLEIATVEERWLEVAATLEAAG